MHKRFLVMLDDRHYPSRGTKSVDSSFDTLDEAVNRAKEGFKDADFAEVFDCDERRTVWEDRR